jgi:hypothetical protein
MSRHADAYRHTPNGSGSPRGEVLTRRTSQHRAQDFGAFLRDIDASVEPALEIHVVLDNFSTHRQPCIAGCSGISASTSTSRRPTRAG